MLYDGRIVTDFTLPEPIRFGPRFATASPRRRRSRALAPDRRTTPVQVVHLYGDQLDRIALIADEPEDPPSLAESLKGFDRIGLPSLAEYLRAFDEVGLRPDLLHFLLIHRATRGSGPITSADVEVADPNRFEPGGAVVISRRRHRQVSR